MDAPQFSPIAYLNKLIQEITQEILLETEDVSIHEASLSAMTTHDAWQEISHELTQKIWRMTKDQTDKLDKLWEEYKTNLQKFENNLQKKLKKIITLQSYLVKSSVILITLSALIGLMLLSVALLPLALFSITPLILLAIASLSFLLLQKKKSQVQKEVTLFYECHKNFKHVNEALTSLLAHKNEVISTFSPKTHDGPSPSGKFFQETGASNAPTTSDQQPYLASSLS